MLTTYVKFAEHTKQEKSSNNSLHIRVALHLPVECYFYVKIKLGRSLYALRCAGFQALFKPKLYFCAGMLYTTY